MKANHLKSFISLLVLLVFILLAAGSFIQISEERRYLGDGIYEITMRNEHSKEVLRTYKGAVDEYDRLQGEVEETLKDGDKILGSYVNGKKEGMFYYVSTSGVREPLGCYSHGELVDIDCSQQAPRQSTKAMPLTASATSSAERVYSHLQQHDPLFFIRFAGHGYSSANLLAFIEELLAELQSLGVNQEGFVAHYHEAFENLVDESAQIALARLLHAMGHADQFLWGLDYELRLAVIDRHRNLPTSTFAVLEARYPQFFSRLEGRLSRTAMRQFTDALDARMDQDGPFDHTDPLVVKQITDRMEEAMNDIASSYQSTLGILEDDYKQFVLPADPLARSVQAVLFGATDPAPERNTAWQVTEIYLATLGYAPDAEGLNYWVNNIHTRPEWEPLTVAQSFFDQELVQALYPESLGYGALIEALYQNIFGRPADRDGYDYWLADLNQGRLVRNQMIIALINGAWDEPGAADDIARFSHRIEVSLAFADYQTQHGIAYSALSESAKGALREAGRTAVAAVTADPASRDQALAAIPGLLRPFH